MLLVKEEKVRNKIQCLAEIFFWIGIFCEFTVSFSGYAYGGYQEPLVIIIGMICFCLKIMLSANWKKDIPLFVVFGMYGLLCYYFQNSALILRIALILLAGRDMNREKVIKLFFWGTLIVMLITGVLSFFGLHNELYIDGVFRNELERRFCFGFFHPNGFSFFVFRLLALGYYLYGEQLPFWKGTIAYLIVFSLMLLANSKMGIAVTIACYMACCFIKYCKSEKKNKIIYYGGAGVILAELALIFTAGVFMKVNYEGMHVENVFWRVISDLTTGRLAYVNKVFHHYIPSLFGYKDFMEATEVGFINTLYNEGILFFVIYLFVLFVIYRKLYAEENAWGMLLVIGFSVYSLAEAFIPYVNKNGVWMMLIGVDFITYIVNQWKGRRKNEKNQN